MNYRSLLTSKTARFVAGGIAVTLGLVLMYPVTFGIHFDSPVVLDDIPIDIIGGILFVMGIFLVANGIKAE